MDILQLDMAKTTLDMAKTGCHIPCTENIRPLMAGLHVQRKVRLKPAAINPAIGQILYRNMWKIAWRGLLMYWKTGLTTPCPLPMPIHLPATIFAGHGRWAGKWALDNLAPKRCLGSWIFGFWSIQVDGFLSGRRRGERKKRKRKERRRKGKKKEGESSNAALQLGVVSSVQ